MSNKYNVDLKTTQSRQFAMGMLMNIACPIGVFLLFYFYHLKGIAMTQIHWDNVNVLFWIFTGISLIYNAGAGILLKRSLLRHPIIRSEEQFSVDFTKWYLLRSQAVLCMSFVWVYGMFLRLVGARIEYMLFFVILLFVIFLILYPRPKFIEKVLAAQEHFVEEGKFRKKTFLDR